MPYTRYEYSIPRLHRLTFGQTNRYLQQNSPWLLAKSGKEDDLQKIERTVYHCAEAIRITGILLQPYMPNKASELLDMIGVHEARRTFDDALLGVDETYGDAKNPVGKDAWDALFPPLPVET
jgi:methionyl-tRNA synthetase